MWRPLCTSCADARPIDLMQQASSRAPMTSAPEKGRSNQLAALHGFLFSLITNTTPRPRVNLRGVKVGP